MFTPEEVSAWIAANVLDSEAWDKAKKPAVAVTQSERNLARWYPAIVLTVPMVAMQAIWELQGIDPALKYQKHNVKTVTDNGETVSYKDGARPAVAPDVHDMLGPTADELAEEEAASALQKQYGGCLL
ncbi:hypothetical protein [Paenibacillus sp. DMB5]|uniref:hypothetical protein n=1 Tax=Paenibacillus sp. DMB5 TaxID=1780103 RepID=UPI00076CA791|nr:hypothetical protein [Paenibacillus sp. DMB5]KUP22445.1 hypothetical protein AWJ19_27720 [Paenibacillus sp. DMB5]